MAAGSDNYDEWKLGGSNTCKVRETIQKPNYEWYLFRKANRTYNKLETESFAEYIKRVIEWNDSLFIKFNSEYK